jgi:hypothetical protein
MQDKHPTPLVCAAMLVLLLAGCSSSPDAATPPGDGGRTARDVDADDEVPIVPNLNLSAGQELRFEVDEALGDVAVAAALAEGGPCQGSIAGVRTNDRGVGLVRHYGNGWSTGSLSSPWARVAGQGEQVPGVPTQVSSAIQLAEGDRHAWWLSDLGPTSPVGRGFAFVLECEGDASLRIEGARRAVLSSGEGFSSDAAAGAAMNDAVVNGRLSASFSAPARLLYGCGAVAGSCSLEVDGPDGIGPLATDYRLQDLPAGDYSFTLQAANAGFPLIFALGEFHPVTSAEELVALPTLG